MGKRKVLLLAVSVASVVTVAAFVFGLGPFADDGAIGESPDPSSSAEGGGGPQQTDQTDSGEWEAVSTGGADGENLSSEQLRNRVEERYTGPGEVPEFYNDLSSLDQYPPGVDEQLDIDRVLQRTKTEMQDNSFAYNLDIRDTTVQQGMVTHVGTKYNVQRDAALHRVVRSGQSHTRYYTARGSAIRQRIGLVENETQTRSHEPLGTQQLMRAELLRSYIEPAVYESIAWTEVNGFTIVVLQTEFISAQGRQELSASMGEYVDEIVGYGGELYIDETGSLLEAKIDIVYRNRFGEEQGRVLRMDTVFGDTTVERPQWADQEVLEQPSGDPIELVDNRYFRLQPQDKQIPAGTEVRVTTSTSQYNVTVPNIEPGETGFVYLKGGELAYAESEPNTNEYIGFEYSILLFDEQERLVMSKESE